MPGENGHLSGTAEVGQGHLEQLTTDADIFSERVRYQVMAASPLNYPSECKKLMELIKVYES